MGGCVIILTHCWNQSIAAGSNINIYKTTSSSLLLFSFSLRWKGDCGAKKQLWFPANYVEEISPSAAEPDRTVRSHPPTQTARCPSVVVMHLHPHCRRDECLLWILVSALLSSSSSSLSSGDDRKQPSGRPAARKCGCVFLSDW